MNKAQYALALVVGTMISGSQVESSSFLRKDFLYLGKEGAVPMAFYTTGELPNLYENAMNQLSSDNIASVLTIGDFTVQQHAEIRDAIDKLYSLNPRSIAYLEPVIVKVRNWEHSSAESNMSAEDPSLTKTIGLCSPNSNIEKIGIVKPYSEVMHDLYDHILEVPTTDRDCDQTISVIRYSQKRVGKDGFDRILSGRNDQLMGEVIRHELTHLITLERSDVFEKVYLKLGFVPLQERSPECPISVDYILSRQNEVGQWSISWLKKLDAAMEEKKEVPEGLEGKFQREVHRALSLGSKAEVRKRFAKMLSEAERVWGKTELIAELGQAIAEGHFKKNSPIEPGRQASTVDEAAQVVRDYLENFGK